MTAICGYWALDGRAGAAAACSKMQRALAIYGPDRAGASDGGEIALACQLARLLPEDVHDRQPLSSSDGRFTLVADLRLDNRPELGDALGIPPERLALMADSDLLLHAWSRWGVEAVPQLYGDFAFALWDSHQRQLTLVRDFPGGRPLFYHCGDGWFGFASMAKGLHALPDVPLAADETTIARHLALLPMQGSGSFFAGIKRVEPGHMVQIRADGSVESSTWYQPPPALPPLADPQPYLDRVREVFDRAVADRLRSTSRITATLSGGLDSTLVTATAAELLARSGKRITAYTHVPKPGLPVYAAPGRSGDESDLARKIAQRHDNIDHLLVTSEDRHIGDDLDQRFHYTEMPALNLCNEVWLSEICRLAGASRKTVLLTATFGNMTISSTGLNGLNDLLREGRLGTWLRTVSALLRHGGLALRTILYMPLSLAIPAWLDKAIRRLFGHPYRDLRAFSSLADEIADAQGAHAPSLSRQAETIFREQSRGRRTEMLALFWQQELVTLSNKGMLARFGVDTRDPTSDRRLIDLCLSLPHEIYLDQGRLKGLYHRTFADRVDADIRLARSKGLQGADWAGRLLEAQSSIIEEAHRAGSSSAGEKLVDTPGLVALAESIPQMAPSDLEAHVTSYRYRLLRGLSVTHFLRKTEGRNG